MAALPILLLASALTNVTGVVTFSRESLPFVFVAADDGENWRVEKIKGVRMEVGDVVSAKGEREPSSKNRLATEKAELLSESPIGLPPPRKVTIHELFEAIMPFGSRQWYGARCETEGLLRDINRRQNTTQLLVGEGDENIQVEMPWALEDALPKTLVQGARVRVTGNLAYTSIENYDEGIFGRIENIELIPQSGASVEIVQDAPFWTSERLWRVLLGLVSLFVIVFAWAVTLRRMVARRTRELGESVRLRETERIEADAARRERLRLAADLHDGFQQYLAGAMFRLKAAMNYLPKDALESRGQMEKVKEALQHTQNGLRTTLWAMNEESEGPESLMALFGFTARRMPHWDGIVDIACEGEERKVARRNAGTLLLIMQEAVGNAIRHGSAEHVRVRLAFGESELVMSVIDDGTGFDVVANSGAGHYGMASMERRTTELGGTMSVWSKGGLGSKLVFHIPYA